MEFRERRDGAQRFQIQIVVQMLVDVIQHPLHSGMVVFKRRLHRVFLRGNTSYAVFDKPGSTDLAIRHGSTGRPTNFRHKFCLSEND